MKSRSIFFLLTLSSLYVLSLVIFTDAHPLDKNSLDQTDSLGFSSNELPKDEILQMEKEPVSRNKRTVGFLRQIFPGISQIIDRKIQQITRVLFRVVGRLILRGGGGAGGGGEGGGGDSGRKISITLPTYPPIEDEEEGETNVPGTESSSSTSEATSTNGSTSTNSESSSTPNTEIPASSESGSTNSPDSNTIVRKSRDVSDVLSDTTIPAELDLDTSSSTESSTTKRSGLLWNLGRNSRNRRGSLFGSSSSSGNFLLDLVRLIAGSGTTPEKDEEQNGPRETRQNDLVEVNDVSDADSDSGGGTSSSYNPEDDTSGIPGPLTRFALLVNRGITNIIKDLILLCPQEDSKCLQEQSAKMLTYMAHNAL